MERYVLSIDHLARCDDGSVQDAQCLEAAFAKRPKVVRSPPGKFNHMEAETVALPVNSSGTAGTPALAPSSPETTTSPKVISNVTELDELGSLIWEMDTMFNKGDDGKKPVRHINLGTKNAIVRMKELHEMLCHIMIGSKGSKCEIATQTSPPNAIRLKNGAKKMDAIGNTPKRQREDVGAQRNTPSKRPRAIALNTPRGDPEPGTGQRAIATEPQAAHGAAEWQTVSRKRAGKPSLRKSRPEVIVIKAKEGCTYAEILSLVTRRPDGKLDEVKNNVKRTRKTATGDLLLELKGSGNANSRKLTEDLSQVLGHQASVRAAGADAWLEMRNLDHLATVEEIKKAINQKIGDDAGQVNVRGLRKSYRGKQMAILNMPRTIAATLLRAGSIEVGWDTCPIRERQAQKRCYKCLCFGHKADSCTSAKDRTNWCLRCGQTDHKAATCNNNPVCFNCVDAKRMDASHYTGSRRCPMDLLAQSILELEIDLAILSEPYRTQSNNSWAADMTHKAAIWNCGANGPPLQHIKSSKCFVRALIGDVWVYSCYMAPSLSLHEFESAIDQLAMDARALDLVVLNSGSEHTFQRAGYGSVIDVTFASSQLAQLTEWKLCSHYTASDHQPITQMRFPQLTGDANNCAKLLVDAISSACDASMVTRRGHTKQKTAVYWWNATKEGARKRCLQARRQYQRSRGRGDFTSLQLEFLSRRSELRHAIKESKKKYFLELCDAAENDVWGRAYKVAMRKFKASKPATPDESQMQLIVETLFPATSVVEPRSTLHSVATDACNISPEEVLQVAVGMNDHKAPGPDSIPNKALKLAARLHPDKFAMVFNKCLAEGVFPTIWKLQDLVLLPKANKPAEDPSAYRPICLLDSTGKMFEKLIALRVEAAIQRSGDLSPMQFGFRKAKSTIDALTAVVDVASKAIEGLRWKGGSKKYCLVTTLDVKNAFNSANWSRILHALSSFQVPEYLIILVEDYYTVETVYCDIAHKAAQKYTWYKEEFHRARFWAPYCGT
ncbi:uncharacterized protein LOC124461559 [Drosophila willistoni]|uniref:uncharacterized protein LOC124461559 n=1 Tax=Drosophila willistoni TaxID=7260 RepID=UPI001F077B6D|nr:uncharacterized protein LOC124461559 [Drosophila willistoni]